MLVEMLQRVILVMAQVTFVGQGSRVPSFRCRRVRRGPLPIEKFLRDDTIGITSANGFVKLLAIKGSIGALALLKMVDQAGRGASGLTAEGALNARGSMNPGMQMLQVLADCLGAKDGDSVLYLVQIVPVTKELIALVAVEVILLLVVLQVCFLRERIGAVVAFILVTLSGVCILVTLSGGIGSPMIQIIHVALNGMPRSAETVAGIALERGRVVSRGHQVLLSGLPSGGKCTPTAAADVNHCEAVSRRIGE